MTHITVLGRICITLVALLSSACHVGYPFRGPGYDQDTGKVRADVPETVVVAVTEGEIESGSSSRFFDVLDEVMRDLTGRDGLVGYAVRKRTFGRRIWTMLAWIDDDSLDTFLASAAHRRAVREGGVPRESLRYVRVRRPAAALPPSWDEAIGWLREEDAEPPAAN